jgi:predicted permease
MLLPQPIHHAWRSLRRAPAFTIAAVLTLTIGIAASVAIFTVVNGVLLKPLPYPGAERLAGVWHDLPPINIHKANQTAGTYFTYQRLARSFENSAVYQESAVNVVNPGGDTEPARVSAVFATASLVPTLGVAPVKGRSFTEAEDIPNGPAVVVIGEGMWRSRFGSDPGIVGRSVEINGLTREIIGVMPSGFRFPSAETQIWLPLQLDPNTAFPGGFNYNGIARLRDGISTESAQRELSALLPRMVELFPNFAPGVSTQMLLEQAKPSPIVTSLRSDVTSGIDRTLWIVAAAAGLVLLVACANVANLILVRADGRQRELAVREALGAGRARVMAHFLSESVVLAALAALAGLLIAWFAVRTLVIAGPVEIPRLAEVGVDATTVVFALIIAALVAVICSIIPAIRITRIPLLSALREGGRGGTAGRRQHRVRGTIVAAQIALALVALAGSGLLLRSFQQLNQVRPGFDAEDVSTFWMSLPRARYANDSALVPFYARLVEQVGGLPGVREVGLSSRLPLLQRGMNQNPFYAEDDPTAATRIPPLQIYTVADAGYFRTMGIPLLAGRPFAGLGVQQSGEAIISQRTAEYFWKDPSGKAAIGKRFQSLPNSSWYTVIGVVGNARDTSLATPPAQTVYFPLVANRDTLFGQSQRTVALTVKTSGALPSLTSAVQGVLRELDPTLPLFDVRPLQSVMRESTAQLTFTSTIIGAAAVVTLLLGGIGLYGVMAYLVTLRTRELGVRMALGAHPSAVAGMLTRQGLMLTGIGIAAGLALYAGVARFLRSFLYGVSLTDPLTLGGAALVLILISLLATWTPARRAARVDPADTLRAE